MKKLVIMRGLPGSGKSTKAKQMYPDAPIFSTDDFFMVNGHYDFRPWLIGQAHNENMCKVIDAMIDNIPVIVVDNTNTQRWEYSVYLSIVKAMGYEFKIIDLFDGLFSDKELTTRNTHGVPLEVITKMRKRYER
ncbi:MAG: AAA family ATPase [Candidatus Thorarchaeota archaeon]|nr:MAG: ATP-binding protein [Candidatus Fermentibacteria bacterium]HEC72584.1 ATP-binding protein [Thermoplasmatales archaeon]